MNPAANPQNSYWSLFNNVTSEQCDGFTYGQMRFVVALIPVASRYVWSVWHEGLKDWISLDECEDLTNKEGRPGLRQPPLGPMRQPSKGLNVDPGQPEDIVAINEDTIHIIGPSEGLQPVQPPQIDGRLNRRFMKNYAVEVKLPSGLWRTVTENVSLGGLLLRDPIPQNLGKNFHLSLIKRGAPKLNMICAIVKGEKSEPPVRLKIVEVDKGGLLRAWLLDSSIE